MYYLNWLFPITNKNYFCDDKTALIRFNIEGIKSICVSAHLTTHSSKSFLNVPSWSSVDDGVILSLIVSWHCRTHLCKRSYLKKKRKKISGSINFEKKSIYCDALSKLSFSYYIVKNVKEYGCLL